MADLTQQEFFTIADLYPQGVNLWCTSGSLEVPVIVLGVTVPFVDNEDVNVRNTLQQIETITLPVDNDPNSSVEFTITSRVIRGTSPYKYYFYTIQPKNVSSYVSPLQNEVMQDGQVILSPNLRGGSFFTSNYNVTLNTAQNDRTSDYIQLSTSATFATVQDSMYTDTGWTNARYQGSTTNNLTYASIDSAIRGIGFEGTYYPITITDTEINNIDVTERTYSEYFHTGPLTYPSFSLAPPPLFYIDGNQSSTTTAIQVKPFAQNAPVTLYQPGDLLQQTREGQEIMKVVSMTRLNANNEYSIQVIRGWNNTPREELDDEELLFRIGSIRVFELEGNKPAPTRRGKIRIKDTGDIVHLDRSGYVVSGSVPPTV